MMYEYSDTHSYISLSDSFTYFILFKFYQMCYYDQDDSVVSGNGSVTNLRKVAIWPNGNLMRITYVSHGFDN